MTPSCFFFLHSNVVVLAVVVVDVVTVIYAVAVPDDVVIWVKPPDVLNIQLKC